MTPVIDVKKNASTAYKANPNEQNLQILRAARSKVQQCEAMNAIERLPELEELDREPTIDELSEALDFLASGKAPGKYGIPAEELKCRKETLITELNEILCLCWSEDEVP